MHDGLVLFVLYSKKTMAHLFTKRRRLAYSTLLKRDVKLQLTN